MPLREKNQVRRKAGTMKMRAPGNAKTPFGIMLCAWILLILWGCAVTPQKLKIKGEPEGFGAGSIISTQTYTAVSFEALLDHLQKSRVIYVGENHTSKEDHKIQLEVIKALFQKVSDLAVGMEMFDRSYQPVLDQWSAGKLAEKEFLQKIHWYANWRYDFALYRDILNFIKDNHIRLVEAAIALLEDQSI